MIQRLLTGALLIAAASCAVNPGHGEDFTVAMDRPPLKVMEAFSNIPLDDQFAAIFPGLTVKFSNLGSNEIIYSIPRAAKGFTGVQLRFEPVGPNATLLHVSADLPPVLLKVKGAERVTEATFELALRDILDSAAKKLGDGQSIQSERDNFSKLLFQLALSADEPKLARALEMERSDRL